MRTTICAIDINLFAVICAKEITPGERRAIEILVEMIEKASGCRLPIFDEEKCAEYEIVIGMTNRDTKDVREARVALKNGGYAIVAEEGKLFITGNCEEGTKNGIYSFLEDYVGVRFYSLDYTVIREPDKVADIPVGTKVVYSPIMEHRDVSWDGYFKVLGNHVAPKEFASHNKLNVAGHCKTDGSGALEYAEACVHTLSLLAGEVTRDQPEVIDHQPCLSDENVYQTALANVKKWLDKNPQATIVSVSQNDSHDYGVGCQCEKCRAIDEAEGTPMGSLLTFVNRIARDIKDEYPGIAVDTLAYRYTRKAPKNIVPEDNVIIRLCAVECCFAHPFDDDSCEDNLEFKKDVEAWAKICKRLYIWDYTTNFSYYIAPFPNLKVLWENFQFYRRNNVVGAYEQGNYESENVEFRELRTYLLAKLLWNPDMTKEDYYTIMDEFLQDFYGAGWKYIREYIDITSEIAAKNHLHLYDRPSKCLAIETEKGELDLTLLNQLKELWNKALAAESDEIKRDHVEKSMLQNEVYSLYIHFSDQKERQEKLFKNLKKYKVTHHRECRRLPEQIDFGLEPKQGLFKSRSSC